MDRLPGKSLIEKLFCLGPPDEVGEAQNAGDLLREIVRSGLPESFVNDSLRQILHDDQFFDDGWQHNRIVIAAATGKTLALSAISKPSRFAYTLDAHAWIAMPSSIDSTHVDVEEYRIGDEKQSTAAGQAVEFVGRERLLPGEVRELSAGHAYRLTPLRQSVVLSFSLPPTANTLTKIDCEELRAVEAQHIQNDVMAICSAAEILGEFGDARSFDELAHLLGHQSPHVRWAAATALVQISPSRAANEVCRLRDDPDDQVRTAARITATRLSEYLDQPEAAA